MKNNKKMVMAASFCLGAMIFATSAFADVVSKTGYDQLKDAVKATTQNLSEKAGSFTIETEYSIKDNGNLVVSNSSVEKYDSVNGMRQSSNETVYSNGVKESRFNYNDKNSSIFYDSNNDTYFVSEYPREVDHMVKFDDPFKEDRVGDVEKIFDAVIGNLKEQVIVDDKSDGSKEFTGSLSDSQIPVLINTVSSYFFKQTVGAGRDVERANMPQLVNDIFIKKVSGDAVLNKDGLLDKAFASATLSGNDKDGSQHDITMEMLIKVSGVNSTVITKPDLTGKKVTKSDAVGKTQRIITNKYLGKWKNDIITEENESFKKVGERIVEITSIDDKYVSGKYSEIYLDPNSGTNSEMEFKARIEEYGSGASIEIAEGEAVRHAGAIHFEPGRINFYSEKVTQGINYNPSFTRVFDN